MCLYSPEVVRPPGRPGSGDRAQAPTCVCTAQRLYGRQEGQGLGIELRHPHVFVQLQVVVGHLAKDGLILWKERGGRREKERDRE